MRRTPDFGAFRCFSAACLPRRDLAGWPPVLERRRIAHPRLGTTLIFKEVLQQGFAGGGMGFDRHFALRSPAADQNVPKSPSWQRLTSPPLDSGFWGKIETDPP
jgi:hypothetical protein